MFSRANASVIGTFLAAVTLASSGVAWGAEPTVEELKAQLTQLQARLDAVEQKQSASNADVARTVQEVFDDAQKRSQLLAKSGDITAGYDKGFFIRSSDGNFLLKPGINFQFRNVTNYLSEDDDLQNGFEVRRLRLRFDGNVFTPKLTYLFQWDTSRSNGGVSLLDAYAQYRFTDQWAFKLGQFKESVFHEKDVTAFAQLAVDRSLLDGVLGGTPTDRVQGISLIYGGTETSALRVESAYHDGANSKSTDWQDGATTFGFGERVEYKFFGKWADYKEFTARSSKQDLFIVGAGGDFTESGDTNQILYTVDAQYKTSTRWTVFGALQGRTLDSDGDNSFSWGALGQIGYAINQKWEPFVRYDITSLEEPGDTDDNVYNEFAVGFNYYCGKDGSAGQRAKFSMDFLWLPDGAPSDQTGLGILASDDAEYVLRAQFQLML